MKDKSELRREMKALRAAADRPPMDAAIFENLFSLPLFAEGESYFLYNSVGSEADTSRIAAELLRRGKAVFFPRTEGKEMFPVRWTGGPLRPGAFGIGEPEGPPFAGVPQICLLPMLAADASFFRLGYGGGYYDRWLARVRASGAQVRAIGICYHFQLADKLPAEPHDVPLDALVTDREIRIRKLTEETR